MEHESTPPATEGDGLWRPGPFASLGVLAALAVVLYGSLLVSPRQLVPCLAGADFFTEFGWRRLFGFAELRRGNLALWNPWVCCGMPFHGYQQSGLLYPPNWLYMVLSVGKATVVTLGLQLVLTGWFACLWLRYHRVHALAALTGGALFMFSGAVYLHVMAGHLTVLGSVAWLPLVLLAAEAVMDTGRWRWAVLGAGAMGMQVLAGHTQYVFFTGLTVAGLAALRLRSMENRWRRLALLAVIPAGTLLLGAAQLVPAMAASAESNRAGGIPFELAAQASLPPESLLTLFVPGFFGNHFGAPYWGRWFVWETSLFVGVTTVVLALIGRVHGDAAKRRWALTMVIAAWILALGAHTPLLRLLHDWAPGFGLFRGWGKMNAVVGLYTILLAMTGLERLLIAPLPNARRWAIGCFAAAGALLAFGALGWSRIAAYVMASGELTRPLPPVMPGDPFWQAAGHRALLGAVMGAALLAAVGAMLWLAKRPRRLAGLIGLLAVELLVFAWSNRAVAEWNPVYDERLMAHLAAHPEAVRIHYQKNPNIALYHHRRDIWAISALMPGRYAEFMAVSQGVRPEDASQVVLLQGQSTMFRMLSYGMGYWQNGGNIEVRELDHALPRVSLIRQVEVIPERDRMLARLAEPDFDPAATVLLETPAEPAPEPGEGSARIVEESTDSLVIEADTTAPAVLLLTDSYSRDWRATGEPGSAQAAYTIQPGDYTLRAIPLSAGHHRLRLTYSPPGYGLSLLVSGVSWLAIVMLGALALRGWLKQRSVSPTPQAS